MQKPPSMGSHGEMGFTEYSVIAVVFADEIIFRVREVMEVSKKFPSASVLQNFGMAYLHTGGL